MDNLPAHKPIPCARPSKSPRQTALDADPTALTLTPLMAFSKLKAFLKKTAARTVG